MAQYIPLPDGSYLKLKEGESFNDGWSRAQRTYPEAFGPVAGATKPESGFFPALKAGKEELMGGLAALAGRTGLMGAEAAQKEYEARQQKAKEIFAPTEAGWTEAPGTKLAELLGGSLPYMAAPVVAGLGAATLPLTGTAATVAGLGAAGLASTAQFTATNLSRQLEEGKGKVKVADTDLGAAALAAIPQAALDTVSMRMIPGVGRLFGRAGVQITEDTAAQIANQGLKKVAADYALSAGKAMGTEGLTEAAQQVFERLQAGLSITDEAARKEYFDNFVGGAVLGGALAPAGRYIERGSEQRKAKQVLDDVEAKKAVEARAAEEAKKADPSYLLQISQEYAALEAQKKDLQSRIVRGTKDNPLDEAAKQANREINEQLTKLAPDLREKAVEFNRLGGKNAVAKLQEQQRVAGLTEGQYLVETLGEKVPTPEAPAPDMSFVGLTEPAAPAPAPEAQYAADRIQLANEQTFGTATGQQYVDYLMQDPGMAAKVVANKVALPGLDRSVSALVRKEISSQLKALGTEIGIERETRAAEQAATAATADKIAQEKAVLERMATNPEYARTVINELKQRRADDARRIETSQKLTNAIQLQPTLFPEELGAATRTFIKTPDKAKLAEVVSTALQRDIPANDRALLEKLSDNLDAYARDPAAVADAVDYIYKRLLLPSGNEASITQKEAIDPAKEIKDRLQLLDQAKRSETEAQTQLARRALTEQEKGALVGTTLGPRAQTGVVEEELGKTIADYAQQAKIGTPIREATDEIKRAVQGELPFTTRAGEPAAQTSTAFKNWGDFQDYLGSSGLQMLRATTQDVTNGAYPNVHRATQLVQKTLRQAEDIRAQATAIAKQRQAIIGGTEADVKTAQQLLQNSVAGLERSLKQQTPDPQLIKAVRTAKEKLATAQAARDQLNLQLQDNADKLKAQVEAYETERQPAAVKGEVPALMLGYEAAGERARAQAKESALNARNKLKGAIDTLVSTQRWVSEAQKAVNFIDDKTPAAERNFRLQQLNRLLGDEKKARDAVAEEHARFMRLVRRSYAPNMQTALPDSVFKNFLVAEAKLTDLINAQNKQINGLRLNVNNARMRLNAANVAIENVPETARLRQGLRQSLLVAEQLDNELRQELTAKREAANKPELVQAQLALTKEAQEKTAKATAAQRASERLARTARATTEFEKETQADREARDAELRKQEQRELELIQGTAETVPREQILMETRRKVRQEIESKVDKLDALRDIAEDPESTLDERVEASNQFASIYKATHGALERRDARISAALKKHDAVIKQLTTLREQLAQPTTLTEGQQKKFKNNPDKLAALEEKQRAKLNRQIANAQAELVRATTFLSTHRGIERVKVPTKAERAAPREVESVLAPAVERIAETQTTERKMGPLVKKETVPPQQLRTGTAESRAGETVAGARNKMKESRGRVERDTTVGKTEQQIANELAEQMRKERAEGKKAASAETLETVEEAEPTFRVEGEELESWSLDDVNFSRGETANPSTIANVRAELKQHFADSSKVKVYDTVDALIKDNPQYEGRVPDNARGFVDTAGNKAFLIAENIPQGQTLSVALHEVGAHIGMRETMGAQQYNASVKAIENWAKKDDGSIESRVARAAQTRVEEAETTKAQQNDELLAYAIEEAVNAGVKPTETKSPIGRWLGQMLGMFRNALRKFGLAPKELSLQELVDTAYGAAQLELRAQPAAVLRMYHGSPNAKLQELKGLAFVTPDKQTAEQYAKGAVAFTGKTEDSGGRIYEVDVNTRDTLDFNKAEHRAAYDKARKEWNATHDADERLPPLTSEGFISSKTGYPSYGRVADILKALPVFDSMFVDEGGQGFSVAVRDGSKLKLVAPKEKGELLFSKPAKYDASVEGAGKVADALITKQKSFIERVKPNLIGLGFRTQFIDKLAPLEHIARNMMDPLKGAQMMYYLRMYGQKMNFTSQAVGHGVPQLVEKTRKDGRKEWVIESIKDTNLKDVVDVLARDDVKKAAGGADAANRLFTLYLAALRADRVGIDALNFGGKVTQAQLDAARAEIEANKTLKSAFDEARDKYNAYNRKLLEFAVQTGALNKDHASKLLSSNDYIPFYRVREGVAELMIGKETPVRIGNIKDSPHLQELVGGDEAIFDFLTSSVQNTTMLLDMSLKNLAQKNVAFELADTKLAHIKKASKTGKAPVNSFEFKIDGENHYAILDQDKLGTDIPAGLLIKGLEGIPVMMPQFVRYAGIPARALRRLVTATPVYMARQLFRDSLGAYMISGSDATPVLGALKQIGKASTLEQRGVTGGQVFTGMPEDMTRILKEMQEGKPGWTKALSYMEAKAMQADALTRRAQYESYINQGLSEMEATLLSLESMNFNKRGVSPGVYMATTLIPFMNAQIQSLDVLYKAFSGKMPFNDRLKIREQMITKGLMLSAATLAYAAAMQDDDAYKNARPDEKYNNWFVRVPFLDQFGGGEKVTLRVPIPFELGYIFKALPEALYNTMVTKHGGEEATEAFTNILRQLIPAGSSYGIPQAVKPLIEVGLGKSFFTGRDIESASEQRQEPWTRYRDNTSEAAKMIGQLTNISPVKLEALISGYTGGMGLALLQSLNVLLPHTGPEKAEKRLSDMPVVGSVFQPTDASGIIDNTYKALEEATQAAASYKKLIERGEYGKAQKLIHEKLDEMSLAALAGQYRQNMGNLTKAETAIKASNMTPEKKREALDTIRQAKIQIATSVRTVLDKRAPQAAPA